MPALHFRRGTVRTYVIDGIAAYAPQISKTIERILIGVGNGNDLVAPTVISGSVALATGGTASIDSVGNMNRAALLEANGNIYVALGSHCDQGTSHIHGWVVAYSAANLQDTGSLVDLTNANNGDS
jgi:hypothetical protein